jgi:hypothetical protein
MCVNGIVSINDLLEALLSGDHPKIKYGQLMVK